MSEPALWSWNSKIEKSLPILEKMLKPHFPENLQDLTVFPVKPWTPEKISWMFIVSLPIRCEMKSQKITGKRQQGYDLVRHCELALSSTRDLQFSLCISLKKLFFTTNQHQSLDSVCSRNQTTKLTHNVKVSANCENLQRYWFASWLKVSRLH